MKRYKNFSVNYGITAYEIGSDHIKVKFRDECIYLYTYKSAGKENVEKMKIPAERGKGLTTFINVNVKENYELQLS